MASNYPDDIQFAGLVEAATAAADAHQRDLGKRKRDEDSPYIPIPTDLTPIPPEPPREATLSNSAAVLFREPSENSKKYSRPPLAKVFTSLELAPEVFLKLQNAAKAYMLSDEHPERRDVVGVKKYSKNNDEAKLKLWQCVDEFLQQDNNGERFFGHSSTTPDAPTRTFFWPEDHGRIVKLMMPLLRKMVTNERQRLYAAVTRKQDTKKPENEQIKLQDGEDDAQMLAGSVSGIDPSLQANTNHADMKLTNESIPNDTGMDDSGSIMLRVNIVTSQDGVQKRIAQELGIPAQNVPTLDMFVAELKKTFQDFDQPVAIRTWLPHGLIHVKEDGEWVVSHFTAGMHEWMDGQLKVIVEV